MREEDKIGGKSTVMERSEEGDEWKEGRQKEKEMEVVIACTPHLVIAMFSDHVSFPGFYKSRG